MSIAESDASSRTLENARALLTAGRFDDAIPLFKRLVDQDPHHVEALNALAINAMRSGEFGAARKWLESALTAMPGHALTLNHFAQLQQREGDAEGAARTYQQLLAQQPLLYAARLAYARVLEQAGDAAAALPHYFRAIRNAQNAGRWLTDNSTPPGLRAEVKRAMALVDQHRRALCDGVMQGLVRRFGSNSLDRVAGCVAIQLGEAGYAPADSRQNPTRFPFPGLPQVPYLEKGRIAGIAELEAQTPTILAELQAILGGDAGREKVFLDPSLADQNLRGARGPAVWDGFYFYRHGIRNDVNATACPQTMAAIDRLPLCRVGGHGPEVLFSTLGAGTHLLPHRGVTNARIVCHLPLIVPSECALRVADQSHAWRVGEVVAFDDTYLHEAWNKSADTRVVMIFDLWHPELTEAERVGVRELFEVLGDFGTKTDRAEAR